MLAAIIFYRLIFFAFMDGSCLSASYAFTESGEVCRASALEAYCPDPSGPCLARDAKWEAFKATPACGIEREPVKRKVVRHDLH